MEAKEFKRLLRRAHKRERALGIIYTILGGVLSVILIVNFEGLHWEESIGAKIGTVIAFIAGFGIGGFGFYWLVKALISVWRISAGKHPILQAIDNADKTKIIWVYHKLFEHYRNGVRYAEWHFTMYLEDGKRLTLGLDEKHIADVQRMEQFLIAKFPHIEVGYDKTTRARMKKRLGKRV